MSSTSDQRHELARTMSALARDLEAEPDEKQTLAAIVQAAVATVPGVVSGGISQVHRRQVTAQVPSDELARQCDELQNELGEGPCLDAIWQQHTVLANDLATDSRWPAFGARASELGAGSLVSFQLYVQQGTLGALNLYGDRGVRFGDEEQLIGEVFATHAALALSGARQHRQFNEAVASRDAIGQAKGLLMCRHDVSAQRAFDLLVRASQESNIKLTEVASWLVNTHEQSNGASRPRSS
ncbi:GAF and ANTAR domain-containing protein [Bounagaea algeriensis]